MLQYISATLFREVLNLYYQIFYVNCIVNISFIHFSIYIFILLFYHYKFFILWQIFNYLHTIMNLALRKFCEINSFPVYKTNFCKNRKFLSAKVPSIEVFVAH